MQVAIDATALTSATDSVASHTLRGIGRYMASMLLALVEGAPQWSARHLRIVVSGDPARLAVAERLGRTLVTRRITWRRQDLGWWTAWLCDRLAIRGHDIDVWHGLDPNMPLSPLPLERSIITAYDLIPLHEPQAMAQIRPHRRPVYRLYLERLRRSPRVIAISQTVADDLVSTLGIDRERLAVVYPAVVPPPTVTADETPPGAPRDLLFVGVPDPTKQPELAIAALADCRRRGFDVRLRFAGYQRASDSAWLNELAARHGIADAVVSLGRVGDEQLARLYRNSVLLATSRIEGFGLPPVEALLAGGRVVVGGQAPVYREVLGEAAEYAAPDGVAIADAYAAVLARPGEPPTALVERFSPRSVARSLIAAYARGADTLAAE